MSIFNNQKIREKMCAWDGYFFPAVGRQEYCSPTCKNEARRERAREQRDIKAAHEAWRIGEYNNRELAEALIRAKFMPKSMEMEVQRESEARSSSRLKRWISTKYAIISTYILIWIDQRKGNYDAHIGSPSSTRE